MKLGLDASCSCCGWAFFDGITILDAGFIDLSKVDTNKEKAYHIIKTIGILPLVSQLVEIKLEAALSGFMRGRTSQQVVIKLARFNAVLEYILGEHFKLPVTLIGANTARKSVLGKAFVKGMTAKDYVRMRLPEIHPEIKQFEQKNRKDEWNVKNGDMYDAAVISAS